MPDSTRRLAPIVLAGLLLFPLAGPVSATEPPPPFDQATLATARADLVTQINGRRASAGLAALPADPTLMAIAQARAEVMARTDILSHTEPDGTTPVARLAAAGVTWSAQWGSLGTTIATARSITSARGHVYEIRVRSRDRAGNWSAWRTVSIRI